MKVNVIDLCEENPKVEAREESELFDLELYDEEDKTLSGWDVYIKKLNEGNLDGFTFTKDEIDTSVYVVDDGGEYFRMKDGTYMNVSWRGDTCRIWGEEAPATIRMLNRAFKIKR